MQEKALKIIVYRKEGSISILKGLIGEKMFSAFCQVGFITSWGSHWKVTKKGIDVYNSFYKKPTFWEALKGLYCHYILKF